MTTNVQVTSLLDSLPNSEKKIDQLKDLKTLLISMNTAALAEIVPNVSFPVIFECLNSGDGDQVEACCDVLEYLLSALDSVNLLQQFHTDLYHGLCHPDTPVKYLCLKQVAKIASLSSQQVTQYQDIIMRLVQLLGDSDLGTAKQSALILIQLCQSTDGLETILYGESLNQLQKVLDGGDVIRFRVYELVADIARLSPEALQHCNQSGILQQLVNEVQKDDILLQLNCLELLTRLAGKEHGLVYLDQQGTVGRLDQMLRNVDSDPMMSFLLPGLVKFFGNVAHLHPKEACARFEYFTQLLFSLLDSADVTQQVLALETVCFIGRTVEGKLVLEKHSDKIRRAVIQAGKLTLESQAELKLRTLDALPNLLYLEVADQSAELLALTESWFKSLATSPMEHLLRLAKLPSTEQRCATFQILQAVALQPWGQTTMNLHPGFNEYLLDRSTETQKECKDHKFDIVKTLVESPTAMEIFGRVFYVRLKQFYNEGPFYVQVEASVAMEGAE